MRAPAFLRLGAGSALAIAACAAGAALASEGTSFTHKDWELACDNTGRCRAAGYQRDEDENAASILLQRAAGPGTPVEGQLQLGSYGEDVKLPATAALTIAGKPAGTLRVDSSGTDDLSAVQVAALLKALVGTGEIAVTAGKRRWVVSGDGAAAVLLKMDEVQGRLGTTGALVRKGPAGEGKVPGPLPPPVVQAVRAEAARGDDAALAARIRASLKVDADECADFAQSGEAPQLWRLGGRRVLLAALCWRAAYNEGIGYWIASDKPPYDPVAVLADGSDFDPATGTLASAQKGRGLGDCWERNDWVWDGRRFVHTASTTTGMCRLVAPGGPWDLPTLVTDVRKPR